jgi:serine-type D-Ala-D-Ala carboxypeptidase/endopeptidase (penicillin-binding protein 4)
MHLPLPASRAVLKRAILPAFLLVAALGAASGQAPAPAAAPDQAPAAAPVAPAAPAPPSPAVAELQADLRRAFQGGPAWRDARFGVIVVSLDRGDTLFALNPDLPLAPASNMKLFSTAAALYYLGPDFRYSTFALGDGEVRDGVLHGDLILYGTGDPTISRRLLASTSAAFRTLADSLAALGIREVRGDVVGDGSYFDDAWLGEGWREEYRLAAYSAPIGALSFAENVVSVGVLPGAPGGPARIRTTPSTSGLAVANRVRTVASGATQVRFQHTEEGLTVSGQIARGHGGITRSITVVDPVNYAAAAFRSVLEERGIAIAGGLRTVSDAGASSASISAASNGNGDARPAPRVLAVHLSPTMLEVATVTNHVSQNLYAEALLKTVGRVALGEGTFQAGARAILYFLECEGRVDGSRLRIVDGSGLSPLNRITGRATVELLALATRAGFWEPFSASLPPAGQPSEGLQHSLRNRMGLTPAAGNARAKTGTIMNASSLAGYVRAANGERLAFAIYGNDVPSTALAKRMEDAAVIRLARFSRPGAAPAAAPATPEAEAADPQEAPEPVAPPSPAADPATPPPATPRGAPAAAAPDRPAAPAAEARTHRVRAGETLDGIARRYGTTVAAIERANPGLQPRRLQVGRTLRIP